MRINFVSGLMAATALLVAGHFAGSSSDAWATVIRKAPIKLQTRRAGCSTDIKTTCAAVKRGAGRVLCCLKQNETALSADCKAYLAKDSGYRMMSATGCTTTGSNAGVSTEPAADAAAATTTTAAAADTSAVALTPAAAPTPKAKNWVVPLTSNRSAPV